MDFSQLIQEYGYLAVALGSFLEGEAVLLAGSFAASQGKLEMALVLPIAALASFLGDLPYFFAGRRYGESAVARFPTLRRHQGRLQHLMRRHHTPLVLSLRFMYGLRIAGLLSLGMSKISALRFLCLDFIGALIWASGVCAAGYGIGRLINAVADDIGATEQVSMIVLILLCGAVFAVYARRRQPRRARLR